MSSKTPLDAPRLALSNGVRGAASVLQVPERQGRKEDDFRRCGKVPRGEAPVERRIL